MRAEGVLETAASFPRGQGGRPRADRSRWQRCIPQIDDGPTLPEAAPPLDASIANIVESAKAPRIERPSLSLG
jgi:hypothetical protein